MPGTPMRPGPTIAARCWCTELSASLTPCSAVGLVLASALWLPAVAGAQSLEQRVARLEQISSGQSLSDLVLEVQRLQQEIRELRGELEVQQHLLEGLRKPQRDVAGAPGSGPGAGAGTGDGAKPAAPSALSAVTAPRAGARELPPAETPGSAPRPPAPASQAPARKAPTPAPGEEQAYQKAFDQLQKSHYEAARADFEAFLVSYPEGAYADSARYWLGESSYVQKDYDRALEEFNRVIAEHADSPKVPGALLKIGYIYDAQRNTAQAREALQALVDKYPDSTEARLAKNRLEKLPK